MWMVGDLLPSLRGQVGVGTGQPRPPSLEMLTVCGEVTWTCLGWIFSSSSIYKTFSEPQFPRL